MVIGFTTLKIWNIIHHFSQNYDPASGVSRGFQTLVFGRPNFVPKLKKIDAK